MRYSLILVGLSVLLWAPRLKGPIDLRWDSGVYYILGSSLAEGKGYRLLNEPGEIKAVQYPPLLPAIVAVHEWALQTNDPTVVGQALRITYFIIFTLYMLAAYWMARQFLSPGYSFLVVLITALYLFTYYLSDLLFAEIPFALAATLFVITNRRSQQPGYFVMTALLGVAAFLLRTAGIALLGAWIGEALLRRQWKQLPLRAAIAVIPFFAWQGYISTVQHSEEYKHPAYAYQRAAYQYYNVSYAENLKLNDAFVPELGNITPKGVAKRLLANLKVMPVSFGEGISVGVRSWRWMLRETLSRLHIPFKRFNIVKAPIAFVGLMAMGGIVLMLLRRQWIVPLYLAGSVLLICLTSFPAQFTRYMAPITPFLALSLVVFIQWIRSWLSGPGKSTGRDGLIFAVLVLGGIFMVQSVGLARTFQQRYKGLTYRDPASWGGTRLFYYDDTWRTFDKTLHWIRENTSQDDVIVTSAPHWTYLRTGRKAVLPPFELDLKTGQELMDSIPAKYVIVDNLEFVDVIRRYTKPTIEAHPQLWHLVYSVPEQKTFVYERMR